MSEVKGDDYLLQKKKQFGTIVQRINTMLIENDT
jgi:hypothetical protein